ncbi:leucine-rich repeat protein [Paenibacillus qinlingensis]|uniref:SLH domain-containing protein n=1 Tax=Paenibacillus qinlingensis TaxID=1837343 RepID=A0ABU1P5M9_9BACL|nr:leucine-rich repeat protein [Paenibacillus qinlingensis]MDR6555063.1 hypothetical protein [Paenibacillus qinlingensis]
MKKLVLSLIIVLFVFWTSFSQIRPVYAVETDFTFTVGSNGATVTDYKGTDLNVVIPEAYAGTTVTEIGRSAFDTNGTGKPKITSVIIPSSVKVIQTYGFRYTSLTSIDLPDGLLTIGSSAFENNPLTSVVFPDSVTMIGNYSFYMNKLTSIKLPENLKTINGGAFDTNHIAKLVIPAGVTKVDSSSFYNNNLTSITVLGDATTFGSGVFTGNPVNLKIFGIANSPVYAYASSNGHSFVDGTVLFQAVAEAKSLLKSHLAGTGVGQVPANTYNDLSAAYDAAMVFIDGIGNASNASDLANAAIPLTTSNAAFRSQIIQAGNPTALGVAITSAQQALIDHPQGTNVGQASEVNRSDLQNAITVAQQIFNQATQYLQVELDVAVTNLQSALDTFENVIISAGSPTALGAAITTAQQALTDHPQGTNVGQASAGTRTALQTTSNAAQQIFDNAGNYTQDQLDTAVNQLNTAVQVFNAAVIQAGNSSALGAAITVAQQALTDHPEGTDVGQTSAGTRTALQTASNAAQQIFDNAGNYTQDQLNTAVNQLNAAVQVFNAAVIQAGNSTALGAAITAAQQALTDHPEGTDVGQTSAVDRAALQTAIDTAQTIVDDAKNQSQTRLNEAIVSLNDAIAVFEASWIGVVLTASANDLYGSSDTIHFTVFYGYEVTVMGTPAVPILIGDDSVTQTVYAPYTGERSKALRKLNFEYQLPAGLADVDGIKVAASLDLPNGASIIRTSSGLAASLTYAAPDLSGIRIVAIPPDVTLTAASDGSSRKMISVTTSVYGVAAGNALKELRWLSGSLSEADFSGGTKGTDILASSQFAISANGDYTVYAVDAAGNETVKTITVTGISIPSFSYNGDRPITLGTTVKINMDGGITAIVDPSDITKITLSDGMVVEQVILPERTRERVLELLKDVKEPFVSINIGNREQAVQTQFPADWIAEMAQVYPNAIIEVRLNNSSYQLRLNAINLIGLAERLDTEVSELTLGIIQVQVGENVRQEINRLGVSQGFAVVSDVFDYKVTAEANGQTLEVHDYGGTYSIRTIKLSGENMNRNLVAVQYIPANGTVVFVPAQQGTSPDGTNEAILNVPHNSLYTVVDVKARTFTDLNNHWAKATVEHLASKLLVNGVAADRFAPEGTISRAEFSAMLVRGLALSVKESGGGARFTDVPASAWYASAVNTAVASNLVSGMGTSLFAPNDRITREQMAVMIASALTLTSHGTGSEEQGQEGRRLDAFTDREAISSWAQEAVVRALEDGILNGMDDGRFAPKEYATRAQAAVILKRFLQFVHFID